MRLFLALAALLIGGLFSIGAVAQTFDFSGKELRDRFDAQLRKDGGDTIRRCVSKGVDTYCEFNDQGFMKSVEGFKKLNLVNGTFKLNEALVYSENKGRVNAVTVIGDRSDPMNTFHFIGQVGSLMATFDGSMTADDTSKEAVKLGLTSGDADPMIGKPRTEILNRFAVTCLMKPSSESTSLVCQFEPRY